MQILCRFRPFSVGLAALAGLVAAPAIADENAPDRMETVQPSSQWNIDFGEDNCRLARAFGEGDDRHIIFIEQAGPSRAFGLTMAGPRLLQFRGLFTRLQLREEDGFPEVSGKWGEVDGFGTAAIFSRIYIVNADESDVGEDQPDAPDVLRSLPAIDLGEAEKVQRVVFGHRGNAIAFETGDMAPALQALNVCAADFVRAWGLDPEQHESFRQMARWKNETRIARRIARRYPSAALNRGEQAILRMRVIVETDGSVSDCHLQEATQTERLRSNACEEMDNAEFEPALDASGEPMRSFYVTNIIYQIGGQSADGSGPYGPPRVEGSE